MRLGAPITIDEQDPERWVLAVKAKGYRAAYCPVQANAGSDVIRAYASSAKAADIVISEVGAWKNPLDSDSEKRKQAIDYNIQQLALADEIGAVCCVNISGSRGVKWDGPDERDLTPETFDMVVETVRGIIDAVQPKRSFYTLEPMPWMYPDSPDSYLELIAAIDRPQFSVHFDPVNWICSPQRYFHNGRFLTECVDKLGGMIKSVHAKDTLLGNNLTAHFDEVRPGLGRLDYRTLLRELNRLPADLPIMLEHLPKAEEYDLAAAYVREVAKEVGVEL
jgi:sugar phosphate isomerase/epimerase